MKNIKSIIEQISELKEKMKEFIRGLPEAQTGVKLLGESPRCGTVTLSTIAKNNGIFCPRYYLNATAKEELLRILDKTPAERLEDVINQIVKEGSIPNGRIKLNPEFIAELKKIWEE